MRFIFLETKPDLYSELTNSILSFFFLNREGRGKGVSEKEGSLLKFSVDMLSCTSNYKMAGVMITVCSTGDKIGNLYIQICNYNQLQ